MKKTISIIFVLLLSVAIGNATEKEPAKPANSQISCSGTITIFVDGYETITHNLTGNLYSCSYIRKLYVEDNSSEGSYDVSSSGVNVIGIEDSSSDDIKLTYEPTSTSFSITVDIDTSDDPSCYGNPGPCGSGPCN